MTNQCLNIKQQEKNAIINYTLGKKAVDNTGYFKKTSLKH